MYDTDHAEAKGQPRLLLDLDALDKAIAVLQGNIEELGNRLQFVSAPRMDEAEGLTPVVERDVVSTVRRRLDQSTREIERRSRDVRVIIDHLDI